MVKGESVPGGEGDRIRAIVPAAGKSERFGGLLPKQYCEINGKAVIIHTLEKLNSVDRIESIQVGLSPDDDLWQSLSDIPGKVIDVFHGGETRAETVIQGLKRLTGSSGCDDWVLIHDAARPCVRVESIKRLIEYVLTSGQGGLLAVPVTETLKRASADGVAIDTVDRRLLWRAQTPQMFRTRDLLKAMLDLGQEMSTITDEASAMERAGLSPLLVHSHQDNIKITTPEDLRLAELLL